MIKVQDCYSDVILNHSYRSFHASLMCILSFLFHPMSEKENYRRALE